MSDYELGEERVVRYAGVEYGEDVWIDEGELVRCRDCAYWRDEDFCANPQWQTGGPSNGLISFPCTFPEDFCSYAEKMEANDER